MWLAYTIRLGDLLLNAAALHLVIELDELMYDAFATPKARLIIKQCKPLPTWRGKPNPLISFLFIAVVISVTQITILSPQERLLEDAQEAICGGNLDFVLSVDQAGVVVATEPALGRQGKGKLEIEETYKWQAVKQLVDDKGMISKVFGQDGSLPALI